MALLEKTPKFDIASAESFARKLYGVELTAPSRQLDSDRDQNFLIESSNEKFVLKIANAAEDRDSLAAQNELMKRVGKSTTAIGQSCATLVDSVNENQIESVEGEGDQVHLVRLVTFVPGKPVAELTHYSDALLRQLGATISELTNSLEGFDHPGFRRDLHWDLANGVSVVESRLHLIEDESKRKLIETLVDRFKRHTVPLLTSLPQSVIHNDANDGNLIAAADAGQVVPNRIVAVIDFGDAVWSWTVGELAIAIAYGILKRADPIAALCEVLDGYLTKRKLSENESAALFGLVCMRLCVSATMAAEQQRQRPDDPYLSISQRLITKVLPLLAEIPFPFAAALLQDRCGYSPFEHSQRIQNWLKQNSSKIIFPVGDERPIDEELLVMDLGVESPNIAGGPEAIAEPALSRVIEDAMEKASAKMVVGRYLEPRLIYDSDLFAAEGFEQERRTVHMGMDLFAPAGAKVKAPLAGEIVAFNDNNNLLDYGPLIILKHSTDDGDEFCSLYGHLARTSLVDLCVGQKVGAGEVFATLGGAHENGGWPPHLHLQLITDPMDLGTEYPGVCRASRISTWKQFSPDPNLILRVPSNLFPKPSLPKSLTLKKRRDRMGGNLSVGYRRPVKAVRGWKQYLYDEEGRKYIDAYNNVPHVGHCHPRVVEALRIQAGKLNTNTRYLADEVLEYADALAGTMPGGLEVCYFVNSASEANELALRMARAKTGGTDLIVLEGAYHGHSTSLIEISPYKHDGPGGEGAPDWVHKAPVADVYRGEYRDAANAGEKYAAAIDEIVDRIQSKDRRLSGFIAESCPSVGGQIVFPPNYLAEVYKRVRYAGGVCIADDVQTGYGRLGTWFYGFEQQGVVPDVVVLGKPIGNGHPIAALVTTREIADTFSNGMEYFSTFGGNTVSAVVGKAVLDVVQDERLAAHAKAVGKFLLSGFEELKTRHSVIGDVRGSGFFLGIEMVRDHVTLEAADREAIYVSNRMRERGILLGTDGPLHNVVKIRPPMPFGMDDAKELLRSLDLTLSELV